MPAGHAELHLPQPTHLGNLYFSLKYMNLQCNLCFPLAPLSLLNTKPPATFVKLFNWQLAPSL